MRSLKSMQTPTCNVYFWPWLGKRTNLDILLLWLILPPIDYQLCCWLHFPYWDWVLVAFSLPICKLVDIQFVDLGRRIFLFYVACWPGESIYIPFEELDDTFFHVIFHVCTNSNTPVQVSLIYDCMNDVFFMRAFPLFWFYEKICLSEF